MEYRELAKSLEGMSGSNIGHEYIVERSPAIDFM